MEILGIHISTGTILFLATSTISIFLYIFINPITRFINSRRPDVLRKVNLCIYIKEKRINKQSGKRFSEEYIPLYEPTSSPELTINSLKFLSTDNMELFWPFPESMRKELNDNGFLSMEEATEESKQEIKERIKSFIGDNNKNLDIEGITERAANDVAERFLSAIKEKKLRFNKKLYGVCSISIGNDPKEDKIYLYESDYFTFKFTVEVYRQLIESKKIFFNISNHDQVKDAVPFLNSIGIGGFIIIDRGGGDDEIMFCWRSDMSCESGGYWHFSYDETFTPDDAIPSNPGRADKMPDLKTCLRRALSEECGIEVNEHKCVCDWGVIDAGLIHTHKDKRYEFEVRTFVRIKLSKEFTMTDFKRCFMYAKDREIESSACKFKKINELDKFVEEESKHNFSPESLSLAYTISQLKKRKLIKDSFNTKGVDLGKKDNS